MEVIIATIIGLSIIWAGVMVIVWYVKGASDGGPSYHAGTFGDPDPRLLQSTPKCFHVERHNHSKD